MSAPAKILIIRLSSLGDILHTIPAYRSLRETYPQARIDWLVEKQMRFLLSVVPGLDNIIEIDTHSPRERLWKPDVWADLTGLIRALRSTHYDIALDFQGLIKTAGLGFLSGARTRIGFGSSLVRERPAHWFYNLRVQDPCGFKHVVGLNLGLAKAAGGHIVPLTTALKPSDDDVAQVHGRLIADRIEKYVIINPGGGWPTKRWSPTRFGSLALKIRRELGLPVLVTTASGEEDLYDGIAAQCGDGVGIHHYQVPFLQLIPLLKKAMLFIAGDTGPFHLACILGTPVVGILGPTSPERNGPWKNSEESVYKILPCSFCYGRSCPTGNECMDLSVDEVFDAVKRRLGRLQ